MITNWCHSSKFWKLNKMARQKQGNFKRIVLAKEERKQEEKGCDNYIFFGQMCVETQDAQHHSNQQQITKQKYTLTSTKNSHASAAHQVENIATVSHKDLCKKINACDCGQ